MANEQTPALETMLSELLRDPARMAQLQSVASSLGLTGEHTPAESNGASAEDNASDASDVTPPPSLPAMNLDPAMLSNLSGLLPLFAGSGGNSAPKKTKPDHRTALLLALRPYLNDNRREMIDAIVNFSRLGEMLGKGKEG